MAHRIRTSPGVAMTFRCLSGFKFKCIFGSGFCNPTNSTKSTRMAHAASIVDCAVAGSSKIAVSASKPAASVCAAGAVAPLERADASKERTSPAVARFIFLATWGFYLLAWVLRYKYAYGACFFEKKCFFFGCTEAPYTGGSKKLYLALDLKRKKKKKRKRKEKSPKKEPTRERCSQPLL